MALKFNALVICLFLFGQIASGQETATISDPIADFIKKAVLCSDPREHELVLRYRKTDATGKLLLNTASGVGMKVGS